jgi:hypothetical protein
LAASFLKKYPGNAMIKIINILCILAVTLATNSRADSQELVMIPGMTICAYKANENICIEAIDTYNRNISWEGVKKKIEMIPRKNRWRGALGSISSSDSSWESHNGITRANVREAQLHFQSMEKFLVWREKYFDSEIDVYRDDGILVSWNKSIRSDKKQGVLDLGIWQIMINQEKPTKLPGSNDKQITVQFINSSD